MIKFISIALITLSLTGCVQKEEPKPEFFDDRASLAIVFGEEHDLLNTLTEEEFLVYVESLKFAFKEVGKGSTLDWTGPDDIYSGHLKILAVEENGTDSVCKDFTQNINVNDTTYKGRARACSVSSTWKVSELK